MNDFVLWIAIIYLVLAVIFLTNKHDDTWPGFRDIESVIVEEGNLIEKSTP